MTSSTSAVPVQLVESGAGRPTLVLHGGGGVPTMQGLADHLAATGHHVLLPTHPGWGGTPRPDGDTLADVAGRYAALLAERDLTDVLVIGSSLGGWLGCEVALAAPDRVSDLVIVNGVGIDVPEAPVTNVFGLEPRASAEHAWHEPDRFFVDPSTLPDERRALMAGNGAAMRAYAGDPYMHDPTLRPRLADVAARTTLLWGESDGVVPLAYGRAYAASFPDARFVPVERAGHLPHVERPEATYAALTEALAR